MSTVIMCEKCGKDLLRFSSGSLSQEKIDEIDKVVNEGCPCRKEEEKK